jgi:hypothetical protein
MVNFKIIFPLLTLWLVLFMPHAHGQSAKQDFSLKAGVEDRLFLNEALYSGQKRNYFSASIQPEYELKWNDEKFIFKATLFGRYDYHDQRRTHADVREFYWQMAQNNHELSIGVKKIFWGVTEAAHLVNIINQTDIVESFDGEEKLGQPMVHYSYQSRKGTFDFFYMPYFRKPTFPGEKGRLRTPFLINTDMISFESTREEYRPDVAVRWSHYIGKFDFGISHFYGTSRQPIVKNLETFQPMFALINQTGIDIQATTGPVLWKVESIHNRNTLLNYTALAAGFEYTFGNVNGKGLDIGLLSEYVYDSRDNLSLNSLQNDVFVGSRLAFNNAQDSQLLAGAIIDLQHNTQLASIEASQRIGESWKVEVEGRFFINTSEKEFIHYLRADSFIRIAVNKYF